MLLNSGVSAMDRYQYLILMGLCLLVTIPLEVVIGARVWRRPARLLRALLPVVAVFVAWDVVAIARGHWHYAERYTTGWHLPGRLPADELVFFLVIPICSLLTLEAVRRLLGRLRPGRSHPDA
ncbi:MAG: Lycopene cyclase [uncultured Acidimicrobiales bacterium]|uniref:Lycopene cyclase n=1 Tax=uncultured Acidimicrobiales bacterium TaxID=310071 RepID=A0A6J4ITV6_9ACTN|nr:MAG: Lycopene cyclase [uncultured Acidimicrobiales bacterium]